MNLPVGGKTVSVENAPQMPPGDFSGVGAVPPKSETTENWEQELLRDPFWPVGFFPPDWQKKSENQDGGDLIGSGWKMALAKLRTSGTSRLGARAAAIINGELKAQGDKIEVVHEGRIYQWEIIGIDDAGQIQLKKLGIR